MGFVDSNLTEQDLLDMNLHDEVTIIAGELYVRRVLGGLIYEIHSEREFQTCFVPQSGPK